MRYGKIDSRVFLYVQGMLNSGVLSLDQKQVIAKKISSTRALDVGGMEWMERIQALDQEISLLRYRNSGVSPCDL